MPVWNTNRKSGGRSIRVGSNDFTLLKTRREGPSFPADLRTRARTVSPIQWRRQLVGTCPLAFERIFFARLYVEASCLVWFGTMPNSNSALFVQPYSLWNDAITGYNVFVCKSCFYRATPCVSAVYSLLSACVRSSVCPPRSCTALYPDG